MSNKKQPTPTVPFHLEQKQPAQPQAYEVLKGLSYFDNQARGEVGDIVTDLPADSIPWLLDCGAIKPVEKEAN